MFFDKISKKVYDFINNGGMAVFLCVAFVGILLSLTGMILTFVVYGFDYMLFIFGLFILCFVFWALYQAFKLVKDNFNVFKKPLGIDK